MTKPLEVVIPHNLGRAEAKRRLENGIVQLKSAFAHKVTAAQETWSDNHLDVGVTAMGQSVRAALDVQDDNVRVVVHLPWMLALVAEKAKGFISREGHLLLEKKK